MENNLPYYRKIIHIDMDAFYASIEQRDNHEYVGKPIAVGGSPQGRGGVVATASYEARKFGIRSAMPSKKALELCPHVIFVRPRFEVYKTVSAQIRAIFERYTDLIEPLSLDEAFLDVTSEERMATILLNGGIWVYGSDLNYIVRIVAGFFPHFPACRVERRGIIRIDHSTGNFQRNVVNAMTMLVDQHNVIVRSDGDDIHPIATLKDEKIMLVPVTWRPVAIFS